MSPAIPRLLQRPDRPGEEQRPAPPVPGTGAGAHTDKGDRRTDAPAPKPSDAHEVGDLERSEREDHGKA